MAEGIDPIVRFRRSLGTLRSWGLSFDSAWSLSFPRGTASRESRPLREALIATRPAWERAYLGVPPERAELAAVTMFGSWEQTEDATAELPTGTTVA
jgi:hypothetical protein